LASGPPAYGEQGTELHNFSDWLAALVGRRPAQAINRRRMAIQLATLVLLVLTSPLANTTSEARPVIIGATVVFLLSCLQQVDLHPWLRLPARLMVLLWLILQLPLPWSDRDWVTGATAATLALLILSVLWLVAQRLVKADRVDAELLCSALGAYLLIGVFWAQTYEIISLAAPAAFTGIGAPPHWSALLYFSFTTLTTTGYGDITAVNPMVRMWAVFEAIIGTIYNATIVARLVSLYGTRVRRED
jgi:hypothetical protein